MSTKIYNSFIAHDQSIETVFMAIQSLRPDLLSVRHGLTCRHLGKAAARTLDRRILAADWPSLALRDDTPDRAPLNIAWEKMTKRCDAIADTRSQDRTVDFSLSVTLFPNARGTLGMVFAEHDELRAPLLGLPGLTTYDFWNSTDRPNNVTEAEWEHRRSDWDRAFSADPRPSHAGLTVTLATERPNQPKAEDVLATVPSADIRARAFADQIFRDEFLSQMTADTNPVPMNQIIAAINEAEKAATEPAGIARIDELSAALSSQLIDKPSMMDIRGW